MLLTSLISDENNVIVLSGTLDADLTLSKGKTYQIQELTINQGKTLTIPSGIIIKNLAPEDGLKSIHLYGCIRLKGTANHRLDFFDHINIICESNEAEIDALNTNFYSNRIKASAFSFSKIKMKHCYFLHLRNSQGNQLQLLSNQKSQAEIILEQCLFAGRTKIEIEVDPNIWGNLVIKNSVFCQEIEAPVGLFYFTKKCDFYLENKHIQWSFLSDNINPSKPTSCHIPNAKLYNRLKGLKPIKLSNKSQPINGYLNAYIEKNKLLESLP